jgi:CheY-like chemotaxis protein
MTALSLRPSTAGSGRLGDVIARQLAAIEALVAARAAAVEAALADSLSREERMDAARRLEVIDREHEALVLRLDERLRDAGDPLRAGRRRAIIAHRHDWFAGKMTSLLEQRGVQVLGHTVVGADAVGWAVAEQPDLVVVDETLAMLPGDQVVRELRAFCPQTVIAAQAAYSDRVGRMLEAGATCVHVRAVPPAQVADELVGLLDA